MKDFFEYRESLKEGFRNSFPKSVWEKDPTAKKKSPGYDDDEIYSLKTLGSEYAAYVDIDDRTGLQDMFSMYKLSRKRVQCIRESSSR